LYPPSCFTPAEALLAEAAKAAAANPEAAARVEFLRTGLRHAKLCAEVAGRISLALPAVSGADTKAALDELMRFRRANEQSGIGNFNHSAWVEDLSWKLGDETRQAPEIYP